MDCIVHGVAKSQTRLSDFHFHSWETTQETCIRYCYPVQRGVKVEDGGLSKKVPLGSCLVTIPPFPLVLRTLEEKKV